MSNPYQSFDAGNDNSDEGKLLAEASRGMAIVTIALLVGAIQFLGIALFLKGVEQVKNDQPILAWLGLGMAMVCFAMHIVVPRIISSNAVKHLDPENEGFFAGLLNAYRTKTIIGLALLEGAAFFNTIAFMIDQQWISLGCVAFLLAAMIAQFPSRGRIESWISAKRREIVERF